MVLSSQPLDKHLTEVIGRLLAEYYDLGKLIRIEVISGGYCNKSYLVWMAEEKKQHRYVLRLYNPNAAKHEIQFEHDLQNHLRSQGFTCAAAILPCRNGGTLVCTESYGIQQGPKAYWALFDFLEGEDKYSWTLNKLRDNELISAAEGLAHFHHCGHGFKRSPGIDRIEPRIMDYITTFKNTFYVLLDQNKHLRFDRMFKDNFTKICRSIDYGISFQARFKGMKVVPIHCDYHPGNLKYRNEDGVRIFDFDWSKIDYRLFDVALSLVYFTSSWDEQSAGLRQEGFSLFLTAYNEACHRFAHICPLTKQEQNFLVPMLSIANLYVLNWELVDFYDQEYPDDEEYYSYLNHTLGLMHWLERRGKELRLWVRNT